MLDGAEEGDINTLAISRYQVNLIEMENILFQEGEINLLNYGVMMMECNIIQD